MKLEQLIKDQLVLPILRKVSEKITYKYLYDYFLNNLIPHINKQGFLAKKSTTQDSLHFSQYCKNVVSGKVKFSLFLDFRKAFELTMRFFCYRS